MPSQAIDSDASKKGWDVILNSQTHTGDPTGGILSHYLLGTSSSFSSIESIQKDLGMYNCPTPLVTAVTYVNQKGPLASYVT